MAPKKKKRSTQSTKIDRISGLPLNIIHDYIFSSLHYEDIKVMSSLSKTWYQITNSFPYLVFHGPMFHTSDEFLNSVTQKLERFRDQYFDHNLRKLEISILFFTRVAPYLDRWIDLALQHNVEELILKTPRPIGDSSIEGCYDLPPSIFAAKSIKVAKISWCSLLRTFSSEFVCNLRQLTLYCVFLDELTITAISSSCPLLEELRFLHCTGSINCLQISNLPKLKCLEITDLWLEVDYTILEIDSPSLENLVIDGGQKLKDMDLEFLSRLPSLRILHLLNIPRFTKLKLSSCTLNEIEMCTWGSENLVELEIDAPNLVSAKYYGEFAPLFASSMCLWNHVATSYDGSLNQLIKVEDFLIEMNNFLSKEKRVEYLELSFSRITCHPFNFNLLHERGVGLTKKIDNLELEFECLGKKMHCTNLLDGVLLICQPRTLSLRLYYDDNSTNNNFVARHICKLIIHHRDHCSCHAGMRWLHHVEKVMSVKEDGAKDPLPMDGTLPPYFRKCYDKIKFIFKW